MEPVEKNILIVEDESRMRKLINAYLKREGFNCIEAENGIDGLKKFRENKVDLIILDIMMPVMDGWTVCKSIRDNSNVPIIILTAKAEEEDKLRGYNLGTDDYVTKPFSPKVLVAKVKAVMKRVYSNEKEKDDELNFDGLILNEISHQVILNGDEIYLSPTEYDLLIYFAKNKGIALSRETILDKVWGYDYFGGLRTVDTNVKRLREKLKDKSKYIVTVRGSGYKFEVK